MQDQHRFHSSPPTFGISFLLQRIISHLPPFLCYNFRIFETWEGRSLFAKTYGAVTLGIDGRIIDVEVDVSPGLPGFELVGLPDTSVKESKGRVTVNLA